MPLIRFMHTPAGRTLRIIAGLLLLAYGALSPTLAGLLAMMAGVAGIVTGLARLPQTPVPPAGPREVPR
ncbi:MAG TPA: hypothetical protein VMN81_07210 [Vicinamibacterales bacterium]|nr:hypothetical protein [Vicinamibacterales bacterium]